MKYKTSAVRAIVTAIIAFSPLGNHAVAAVIVDTGGPYTITTGGSITLDASNSVSTTPGSPTIVLYDWNLDGIPGYESGGPSPTYFMSWSTANAFGLNSIGDVQNIVIRVTNDFGVTGLGYTTITVIPEPSSAVMILIGWAGIVFIRRRK